jgi:hypothetical protein
MMAAPQDWAPYYGIEDAAKVYLRDPLVALDQLRGVVDFPSIQSFFMTRRLTEESWGEALSQEVVATDGRRLIMWRADDDMSVGEEHQRQVLNASVRTILLSTITDHILTTEFEVLDDGTRRLSEVRLRMYTQLITRSHEKNATTPTSSASRSATTSRSTTAGWLRWSGCSNSAGCCRGRCRPVGRPGRAVHL